MSVVTRLSVSGHNVDTVVYMCTFLHQLNEIKAWNGVCNVIDWLAVHLNQNGWLVVWLVVYFNPND